MVLGVIIVVTAITITLGNSVLASEMAWAWERFNNEDTANSRIIQNMASYRMIAAKPLTGWGYDDYNTYSIGFKTRVGDIPLTGTKSTSHNTYLTLMAELGLPTFLFYFFPVIWSLILTPKAWRNLPKNGFWSRRLLILLWLVILHIFIVTNFMDMIRFHPFGTCLWWMTLALISTVIHSALGSDATNVPQWALQPARTMSVPFLCKSK
jgi:O-antigen ligase